jgi:hypothetical protein
MICEGRGGWTPVRAENTHYIPELVAIFLIFEARKGAVVCEEGGNWDCDSGMEW